MSIFSIMRTLLWLVLVLLFDMRGPNLALALESVPTESSKYSSGTSVFDRFLRARVLIEGCRRVACEDVARLLNAVGDVSSPRTNQLQNSPTMNLDRSMAIRSLGEIELNRLIADHPWIEKLDTSWKFDFSNALPLQVVIMVRERRPAFVVELYGESWLVSEEGYAMQALSSVLDTNLILEAGDLPRVSFMAVGEQAFGGSVEKRYSKAILGIRTIYQAGGLPFSTDRYEVLADGSLKITPAEIKYPSISLFARSPNDVRDDLQKVKVVLSDLKAKGERAENIDMRFAKQAVVNYGRGGPIPSVAETH